MRNEEDMKNMQKENVKIHIRVGFDVLNGDILVIFLQKGTVIPYQAAGRFKNSYLQKL